MNRAIAFACLLLSAAIGIASSQDFTQTGKPASRSKIEALLQSLDPRQVAWGAHYALATGDRSLVPVLLSLADNWQPIVRASEGDDKEAPTADQLDRRDAMAAVLDALIQIKAAVPVGTLRNLAADFPNYVALLLSRLPLGESQALSWELYHGEPHSLGADDLQYVSAALLAEAAPPGFAADLFSSIHIRATINVTAPGVAKPGPSFTDGAYGCAAEIPRKDWPEFGVYVFSEGKMLDSFTIVSDAHPVYVHRSKTTHYRNDRCENVPFFIVLGPEGRRQLLANMLGISSDEIDWETELHDEIQFLSGPQFYHDLFCWIEAQQDDYRVTSAALVARNLMTASEQEESLPEIDLHFVDQRGPGFPLLTRPEILPNHVVWHETQ